MKKIIIIMTLAMVFVLGACAKKDTSKTIRVATAFYPMADLLELIREDLKAEGYTLVVTDFNNDYVAPNMGLMRNEFDANMIQHEHFMENFNASNNGDLKIVMPIYHATFALYSKDYTKVEDIPNGSEITLPNDETNLGRALHLLQEAGLITLREGVGPFAKLSDIESNPKNLVLDNQVPLNQLSNKYKESRLAVMYPTYARNLELVGNAERLYVEVLSERTESFAISLVTREGLLESEKIELLKKYLSTEKVRNFLIENYAWASTPAM